MVLKLAKLDQNTCDPVIEILCGKNPTELILNHRVLKEYLKIPPMIHLYITNKLVHHVDWKMMGGQVLDTCKVANYIYLSFASLIKTRICNKNSPP